MMLLPRSHQCSSPPSWAQSWLSHTVLRFTALGLCAVARFKHCPGTCCAHTMTGHNLTVQRDACNRCYNVGTSSALGEGEHAREHTAVALGFMAKGAFAECVSLLLCIAIGFVVGLGLSRWADDFGLPSDFMENRGQPLALLYGLAIAIPSGLGVAMSIAGDNSGGLVGVAISASLLPPAVNTGMCWGIAAAVDDDADSNDLARIGAFSLLLTLLNIFSIVIVAGGAFKWKEIREYDSRTRTEAVMNLIRERGIEAKMKRLRLSSKQSKSRNNATESGDVGIVKIPRRKTIIVSDGAGGHITSVFESRIAIHIEMTLRIPSDDIFETWGMKWSHNQEGGPSVEVNGKKYKARRLPPTDKMLLDRVRHLISRHCVPQRLLVARHRGDVVEDYDIEIETTRDKTPDTASIQIAIKGAPPEAVETTDARDFRERPPPPSDFLPKMVDALRRIAVSEWFAAPRPILPDENDSADDELVPSSQTALVYEEPHEVIVQLVQHDDDDLQRRKSTAPSRTKNRGSWKSAAMNILSPRRRPNTPSGGHVNTA
mmetsp:Transcript_26168/g.78634  ORF Transcript_26168/g.78634 Transcript_26168/m.78634 type:complete len:543 (-) Transcript_26168:17-1645(-)